MAELKESQNCCQVKSPPLNFLKSSLGNFTVLGFVPCLVSTQISSSVSLSPG